MTMVPDTAETVVRASHVPGRRQGEWTYEDYVQLPDPEGGYRYEIIDGVLYMAPAPNTGHETIVAIIIGRLLNAVYDRRLGRVLASPDIAYGPNTLRPDAVVVLEANRGVIAENRLVGPPDLVVEIASPSTAAYDRDAKAGKRGAYARMGIGEYWLVDPKARTVEVLALDGGAYAPIGTFSGAARLASRAIPSLDLATAELFPRE